MRRQRKLTPAQRRVMRQLVADADDMMSGYGWARSSRPFHPDGEIRRKLTRRGFAVYEFRAVGFGFVCMPWPTPKGLAALK